MKKLFLLLLIPFFSLAQFNPIFFYQSTAVKPFVSTWNTANTSAGSSTATQIKLPLNSIGTYNFRVDWGDGSFDNITVWNAANTTHTYASAGTYQVKIKGICTGWQFNNTGDRLKFLSVQQWGNLRLGNSTGYFFGCANLTLSSVSDILNLSGTTTLSNLFNGCTSLTTVNRINEWNTSGVTSMDFMFNGSAFNQNIGNWNVGSVTNMNSMFLNATNYDNGGVTLNTWNVSSVQNMTSMFGNTKYNSPLNLWNTGSCTSTVGMFQGDTVFNQDLSSWNVSNVTNMYRMFRLATNYANAGVSLSSWNPIKTISIESLFESTKYNSPLNSWNLALCTSMIYVFMNNSVFNQDISSWSTPNVTNTQQMFLNATSYDNAGVSLNNWNVSKVTSMYQMFNNCKYNSALNLWNTGLCVDMSYMFQNNAFFNQDVGSWNVSKVTHFEFMFQTSNFNNGGSSNINNWVLNAVSGINMTAMFQYNTVFNQPIGNWNTGLVTSMYRMFYHNSLPSAFNQNVGNWNIGNVTDITEFRNLATPATFSTTNLDAAYNGWVTKPILVAKNVSFGTAKRTAASTEARALMTRGSLTKSITSVVDNGSGLIRVTATAHGLTTGNKVFISGVTGTIEANGLFSVTVIDADTIDLQSSAFVNTYVSGGIVRTGYGWTVTDGGI